MALLHLANGYICLIDQEDLVDLPELRWRALVDKQGVPRSIMGVGPRSKGKRDHCTLARFIMRVTDTKVWVDHVNGDPLDNRKQNLRLCTQRQNMFNRKTHKNNKSGYKGVSLDKRSGLYVARLYVDKKMYVDGYSSDPAVSATFYDVLAKKYHGEFASLNFPEVELEWPSGVLPL